MDAIRILISIREAADLAMVQWAVNAAQLNFKLIPNDPNESLFSLLNHNDIDCIITDYINDRGAKLVLDHLHTLKKTVPLVVLVAEKGKQFVADPRQGRVTVEVDKSQLTPQIIAQTIIGLTQIHREIQRNVIMETALRREKDRFQLLRGAFPMTFMDMDKKGTVLECTGNILALMDRQEEEILGQPAWQVFPEAFDIEDAIYNALSGEQAEKTVNFAQSVIQCKYFPVLNDAQNVCGITAIFHQLPAQDNHAEQLQQVQRASEQSQQKMQGEFEEMQGINQALRQYTHNYNSILENTQAALFQVLVDEDNQLSITYMSRSVVKLAGFDAEQLLRQEVREQLFSREDIQRLTVMLAAAASNWLPINTELDIYPIHGGTQRVQLVAKPSANEHGIQWDGFVQVIQHKPGQEIEPAAIQEIAEERDAALEEVKLKSLFLMSMSREMRSPLETMLTMVNLLLETELEGEQREFAAMLYTAGHALITMTNDIVDVARIETDAFSLTEVDFDLRNLLYDRIGRYQQKAQYKGLKIFCLLPYNLPELVVADAGRMRQILSHLLSNALQYTHAGEVTMQVMLVEEHDKDLRIRFEISDTGMEITPNDRRYLFQMFAPKKEESTVYRSSGLRMLVARQLTEMMGGEFGLFNNQKQGVTFWFNLPFKKSELVLLDGDKAELRGKRVLLVSDNPSSCKIIKQSMEQWGMRVGVNQEGDRALANLIEQAGIGESFDCVILDGHVGGMQDIDMARIIYQDQNLSGIKQILLSNAGERGDSEKAHQAGVSAFLTKPVQPELLQECLQTVLSWSSATQHNLVTKHSLADKHAGGRRAVLLGVHEYNKQKHLQYFLSQHGFRVDIAPSGPEVLNALHKQHYRLVVVVPDLPIWDGYATARTVHNRVTEPPPIVAMVGDTSDAERMRCHDANISDCVAWSAMHRLRTWLEQSKTMAQLLSE